MTTPCPFQHYFALVISCSMLLAQTAPLVAQTYPNLTVTDKLRLEVAPSSATFMELRSNGIMIGRSTDTTNHLLPADVSGSGSLFLWNPSMQQFRAGIFDESQLEGMADFSTALGFFTTASYGSFAGGNNSQALGTTSFAFGWYAGAYGEGSITLGSWTSAVGNYSTAFGHTSYAMGDYSTAMGAETNAEAFASTAIGYMNVGGGDPWEWIPTDPLFEIGNGHWGTEENNWQPIWSNALTVYKNGNATFQGVIYVAAGGDIPMFQP